MSLESTRRGATPGERRARPASERVGAEAALTRTIVVAAALLLPTVAHASSMPGGAALVFLAVALVGSFVVIAAQVVFGVILFRRLAADPPRGRVLPALVIALSLLVGAAALAIFFPLFKDDARHQAALWGWIAALSLSLCNAVWGIVLVSGAFTARKARWPRLLAPGVALLVTIPLAAPKLAQQAATNAANRRASRYVERTLFGSFLGVDDLAFSKDGRTLYSVSAKDAAPWPLAWDVATGERRGQRGAKRKRARASHVLCAVAGGLLATEGQVGFRRGRLLLWRRGANGKLSSADLGQPNVTDIACSADGAVAALGSGLYAGSVTVMRFPERKVQRRIALARHPYHVAISGDGQLIAHDVSDKQQVHVRRVRDGALLHRLAVASHNWMSSSLALGPDGRYLAFGLPGGRAGVFDLQQKTPASHPIQTKNVGGGPTLVAFSADGKELYVTTSGKHVMARFAVGSWKLVGGVERGDALGHACDRPSAVAAAAGFGTPHVIIGCMGQAVVVRLADSAVVHRLTGLVRRVESAAALPASSGAKVIALSGRAIEAAFFSGPRMSRIVLDAARAFSGHATRLMRHPLTGSLIVGTDGGAVALVEADGTPRVRALHLLQGRRAQLRIRALAFDRRHSATIVGDATGGVGFVVAGKLRWFKKAHEGELLGVFVSSGDTLATVASDGWLRLWKSSPSGLVPAGEGRRMCKAAASAAMSRDKRLVAAGCADGRISWTAIAKAQRARSLGATGAPITALAFSPDCAQLLAGTRDGSVHLYQLSDGQRLRELFSPQRKRDGERPVLAAINRILFSPAGDHFAIATASNHRNIHVVAASALSVR